MIALKSSLICRLNVTSPKENHMIDKHKKFQLFSFSSLPIVLILSVHFACHSLYRGQRTISCAHFNGNVCSYTKKVLQ